MVDFHAFLALLCGLFLDMGEVELVESGVEVCDEVFELGDLHEVVVEFFQLD